MNFEQNRNDMAVRGLFIDELIEGCPEAVNKDGEFNINKAVGVPHEGDIKEMSIHLRESIDDFSSLERLCFLVHTHDNKRYAVKIVRRFRQHEVISVVLDFPTKGIVNWSDEGVNIAFGKSRFTMWKNGSVFYYG